MSFRKVFIATALSFAVITTTTGCSFSSHIETLKPYTPSDGSQADYEISELKVRNFLYITMDDKSSLIGSIINQGDRSVEVAIRYVDGVTGEISERSVGAVGAGEKYDIGFNGSPNLEVSLAGVAGAVTEIQFIVDGAEIKDAEGNVERLTIPVVDGTLAEYRAILEEVQG